VSHNEQNLLFSFTHNRTTLCSQPTALVLTTKVTTTKKCKKKQELSKLGAANRGPPTNLATPNGYFRYCFRNICWSDGTADESSTSAAVVDPGHKQMQP